MSTETKILRYLINEIVKGGFREKIVETLYKEKVNSNVLTYLLTYHEVIPFFYLTLKDSSEKIPKYIYEGLTNHYYALLFKYLSLRDELLNILKEAKRENLLLIPIKGLSLAEYGYNRFGLRQMLDIDLLVKETDLVKAELILRRLGYKKRLTKGSEEYWLTKQCHLEFMKKNGDSNTLVDLHFSLDFNRYGKQVLINLWDRLQKHAIEGEECFLLSYEDSLISLALHQRRFGKICNLKYVCDAGLILNNEHFNWDYIIKSAFEEKIRASLYFLLYQVKSMLEFDLGSQLLALKLPWWKRKMIGAVINKYTFSPPKKSLFYSYALCHFLLYDTLGYSIKYIIDIPIEQFAKFYSLPLYSRKTLRIYKIRFLYIPYRLLITSFKFFITN